MRVTYPLLITKSCKHFRRLIFNSLILALLSTIISVNLQAQINYPGNPIGPRYDGNKNVLYFRLLSLQNKKVVNSALQSSNIYLKVDSFGVATEVSLSPSDCGTWDTLPDKNIIWRLGITSASAGSLGLVFNSFHLEPGCKLLVYSPSLGEQYGAYTYRNNRDNDIFAVSPVGGDSLIIELQILSGVKNFGSLILGEIGVGYPITGKVKSKKDRWYGNSMPCELDVRCIDDQEIQKHKHAVCRIIYHGTARCTGTLINNTSYNGRALILTAGHCIQTNIDAATSIFYFDYESPYCNGPDGPIKSISGSKILSRDSGLDFALLEASEEPPIDYNPVYAGWDVTEEPFNRTYTYHHPEGDVKKISVNENLVLSQDYNDFDPTSGFDHNVHWWVPVYDKGSTEAGSSGSALFDSSYRIRGTLTGGSPGCSDTINDHYAKISHGWNDQSDIKKQLKHWLDPINSDSLKCNYYDPAFSFFENGALLSNIDSNEVTMGMRLKSGWGFVSGHNSRLTSEYAEHYYRNGTKYIYALDVNIDHDFVSTIYSRIIFKVWSGNEIPEDLIFSKQFQLFELSAEEMNYVRFDKAVKVNQNFFVGYEIFYNNPLDSFSVQIASPRGENGLNTAFVKTGETWTPLTDGTNSLNTSLAIKPLTYDFLPTSNSKKWKMPSDLITLYPNPAKDVMQILFNQKIEGTITLTVYDLLGKVASPPTSYFSMEPNFPFSVNNLMPGFYILKVDFPGGSNAKKFVKF
jgi:lysyl endopeptidase